MLTAALIVFREVLEAGLIIGIILAATEGIRRRGWWVAGGVLAGAAGAAVMAAVAEQVSSAFAGQGQNLFNASILATAVVMLGWHTVWMARHARELTAEMGSLGRAVAAGDRTLFAMAVVVAVAVLREGAEVVLFLFGVASGGEQPAQILLGGLIGIAAGAICSLVLYRGLLAIPVRQLFSSTNVLISLLAAGMAGQAAVFLVKAGLLPSLGDQLWDTSAILRDDGLVGRSLHALIGYSDRPMGVQVAAYLGVVAVLFLLGRMIGGRSATEAAP